MADRRPPGAHGRPARQRWVKRPPRPSRPPAVLAPVRPGRDQALLGLGLGLALALLAVLVTPNLTEREGMTGLAAGLAFSGGFAIVWRGAGGTLDDLRRLFR